MEVLIDNTQLDCELQEMYIISSHWKTDVDFVKDEIRFLKNTLNKYKTGVMDVEQIRITQFQKIVDHEEGKIHEAESKIFEFLELLGPIVNHAKNEFGLDVLGKFNELETDIKSVTNYILLVKRLVFLFLEKIINAKKHYQAALANKKLLPLKYQL
ncbi:MAG: hypothetical protein JWQ34_3751 [Mucilaginibacter sp.]|uniref:hypothetical protein n=1 Tax=Mucilaginibacter sp. TaxID=1882438 RepID=UPI00261E9DB6|nr:hypothetical protein [Mucilaginibacter sp.]MDB5005526.1 hypothetical protein [Mucilaginibacter sp.]